MAALQARGPPKAAGYSQALLRLSAGGAISTQTHRKQFTRPGGTTNPGSHASPRDLKPGRGPGMDVVPRLSRPRPTAPSQPRPPRWLCDLRASCWISAQTPVTRALTQQVLRHTHTRTHTPLLTPLGLTLHSAFFQSLFQQLVCCSLNSSLTNVPAGKGYRQRQRKASSPLGGLSRM